MNRELEDQAHDRASRSSAMCTTETGGCRFLVRCGDGPNTILVLRCAPAAMQEETLINRAYARTLGYSTSRPVADCHADSRGLRF